MRSSPLRSRETVLAPLGGSQLSCTRRVALTLLPESMTMSRVVLDRW
ncbi:hypothetical protein [Rhodococcus sp. KBS0724]|nr:hypothetical protein [Rhodococcus sp. KBS0724]